MDADDATVARYCAKIRKGNEAAFLWLYDRWLMRALNLATDWTKSPTLAEDATQELFMRVIAKLPALQSQRALDAWMTVTLRRIVLDMLRAMRRAVARDRASAISNAKRTREIRITEDQLQHSLAMLETEDATLLRLRTLHGLTLSQLELAHGSSTGSLQGKLRRAISRLRRAIFSHDINNSTDRGTS
jgi:RNA polymerase sigma factor (sigma-70 family)